MTTLVNLREAQLQRSKAAEQRALEEFREDVVTYGGVLYESLKKRRDFNVPSPSERRELKRHRGIDCED